MIQQTSTQCKSLHPALVVSIFLHVVPKRGLIHGVVFRLFRIHLFKPALEPVYFYRFTFVNGRVSLSCNCWETDDKPKLQTNTALDKLSPTKLLVLANK